MERLAIISHNSFRAIGFHESRSPSSPDGPASQGNHLIRLYSVNVLCTVHKLFTSQQYLKGFIIQYIFYNKIFKHLRIISFLYEDMTLVKVV